MSIFYVRVLIDNEMKWDVTIKARLQSGNTDIITEEWPCEGFAIPDKLYMAYCLIQSIEARPKNTSIEQQSSVLSISSMNEGQRFKRKEKH